VDVKKRNFYLRGRQQEELMPPWTSRRGICTSVDVKKRNFCLRGRPEEELLPPYTFSRDTSASADVQKTGQHTFFTVTAVKTSNLPIYY
jgi:hypothetical protein